MRKLLLILFTCFSCVINAQVVFNQSFAHKQLYGGRGHCLFPMDDDKFAILTGIVECDLSASQILEAVQAWLGRESFNFHLQIDKDDIYTSNRQLIFKAEMPVSRKLLFDGGTPAAFTGVPLDWEVSESDVSFVCKIDIKDQKFRYTFFHITTDRWRLRGDAESEGPINDIHWQRINCLEKKLNKTEMPSKKQEIKAMIARETFIYQKEYEQMKQLEEDLKNCVKPDAENSEFDF